MAVVMQNKYKSRALLAAIFLSAVLLGVGFEGGMLWSSREMEKIETLATQATDKVLALTQEKQILEQKLERSGLFGQGPVWPDPQARNERYLGLARVGQFVVFSEQLQVKIIITASQQAQLDIYWQGEHIYTTLTAGANLKLSTYYNLSLSYLGTGWALLSLEKQ
jgi:hypothetical protein